MEKPTFTIGVFGIVQNENGEILLCLRNDKEIWNLPGGVLEDLEAPWNGVIREVQEETGLDVKVINLLGVYAKESKNDIVFLFQCKIVGGDIALNEEAKAIEWFNKDEIPKNTVPKQVERIYDFFNKQTQEVIMKIQGGKSTADLLNELKP